MQQLDLFGKPVDVFASALDRYGVWPITVWPCDMSDKYTQALKRAIGDDPNGVMAQPRTGVSQTSDHKVGQSRTNANPMMSTGKNSVYTPGSETHTSVFNPAVAAWLLNCYAQKGGVCLDPFAGGGTRAIMAAKHGMDYTGIELRLEEVEAVRARCANNGAGAARIIHGDARTLADYKPGDFLLTCPPYWDLEMYEGGPGDLSMAPTYKAFLAGLEEVINASYLALYPGSYACWVVGLHRRANGELLAMHHDITKLHQAAGFEFREEIILNQVNNGAIQRVGNFDKGKGHLIRTHEYAMVYRRK